MDLAEVAHDEVEHSGSGSCGPVVLSGLIDFHLGHLGLLDLLENKQWSTVQTRQGLRVSLASLRKWLCVWVWWGTQGWGEQLGDWEAAVMLPGRASGKKGVMHLQSSTGTEGQLFQLGTVGHAIFQAPLLMRKVSQKYIHIFIYTHTYICV